jgi:hypothetical protein
MTTIYHCNYTDKQITIVAPDKTSNVVAVEGIYTYTGTVGDFVVTTPDGTYTVLGTGLSAFTPTSYNIFYQLSTTLNSTDVSSSVIYSSTTHTPVSALTSRGPTLSISFPDSVAINNMVTTTVWVQSKYSDIVSAPSSPLGMLTNHWMLILILLIMVVIASIVGVVIYSKHKNSV